MTGSIRQVLATPPAVPAVGTGSWVPVSKGPQLASSVAVVSAEVEMTAYALLTYTLLGDVATALPVVKWLSQQRNALGGFSSTQVSQEGQKRGSGLSGVTVAQAWDSRAR